MPDSLSDQIIKSTLQSKLASQGGYGRGSGVGKFFNFLIPTLAAALPNSPLFAGAEAGREAVNTANFNQYARQQAAADLLRQQQANQNNAGFYTDATGREVANPNAGFDTGFAAQMVPKIRLSNQAPNNNNYLNGQPLQQAQYGDIDPTVLQKYKDRQGEVADTKAKLNFMADVLDQMNAQQTKPNEGTMQTDPNVLAARIGKSDMYNSDPYGMGAISDATFGHGISLRKNEQDNANTQFSNQTTRKHYETVDPAAAERDRAAADLDRRTDPNIRSGGGGNPYTVLNAEQTYLEGQLQATEKKMRAAGFMDKDGNLKEPDKPYHYELPGGLGGIKWGQSGPEVSAKRKRYEAMAAKRDALLTQLSGGAFGGGQAQILTQAGQDMGAGKSGFKAWQQNRPKK